MNFFLMAADMLAKMARQMDRPMELGLTRSMEAKRPMEKDRAP